MPNFPPVYLRHETHARLLRLKVETGFPISHILHLAVETLDEAYDDIDELITVLGRQAVLIGHRGPIPQPRPKQEPPKPEGGE